MAKNSVNTATKKSSAKKSVPKNTPQQSASKLPMVGKILAGVIALSFVLTLYAVLSTKLVPTKYFLMLLPITLLVIAPTMYANIRYKWQSIAKSTSLIVISLVVLIANGYVFVIARSTNNFFNSKR